MSSSRRDLPVRTCTGPCGKTKPLDPEHFHRKGRGADGRQLYESRCIECLRPIKAKQAREADTAYAKRTYAQALHHLRDRHPEEFQALLAEIRMNDA